MAPFIDETIQSVIGQDYPNVECIVIDGGSDDSTLDILKRYENRIKWVSEKDKGQSDAINKGIALATGDILTYLNADDSIEPGCLKKVADYFSKNTAVMWLYGKCLIVNGDGKVIRRPISWYKSFWQKRYTYSWLLIMDFISQPTVFWRSQLTEEIGLFDITEHLAMDYDYWLRAGAKYRPGYIDSYLARFRLHSVSKSSTSFGTAAKAALKIGREQAILQRRWYVLPFQYLTLFLVVGTYSILLVFIRLRRMNNHMNDGLRTASKA